MYIPSLASGFIWDDDDYVTQNATLRTSEGLRQIWLDPQATPQYYPLVFTTFWVEDHLWGLHPAGYHLVNAALHATNGVLVWLILRRLSVPGAWLAALAFGLHPVHVESVSWISERKNVLSALFYLLALRTLIEILAGPPRTEVKLGKAPILAAIYSRFRVLHRCPVVQIGDLFPSRRRGC